MAAPELRFRAASPELLRLPWRTPLASWDPVAVTFRDIPVGASRHLVRFVEADGRLWALKELPAAVARHEYEVLRVLEQRALSSVRPAGVVLAGDEDRAVLVTHYLEGSWQYRRLLLRVPLAQEAPRSRLFEAMAALLVDLHRSGVWWGDCSLANALFLRDGQHVQAWLVDAETAEVHDRLSDGQRRHDLDLMTENVTGGLFEVAARRGELDEPGVPVRIVTEAEGIAERYERLWALLTDEPVVAVDAAEPIEQRVRTLEDTGFEVEEVRLEPLSDAADRARLRVAVAGRRHHADRLRQLTGLAVGEGQARLLLGDLGSYRARLSARSGRDITEAEAGQRWLAEVFVPGSARARQAVGHGDPTQAYCDLLEVRWLLSEEAGHDVGDEPALAALAARGAPEQSAAQMGFVELPTAELPALPPEPPP